MFARGVYPASADLGFGQSFTKAEQLSGVSLGSFIASVSTSVTIFAVEVILFFILQRQLPSIYPTFLELQRITNEYFSFSGFLRFAPNDVHLDRYFFRRYLRTLILLFLPAASLIVPVLIPLNYIDGKGSKNGVSGLDALGWSSVGLSHVDRYWAHLALSLALVSYACWLIWVELIEYVSIRQNSRHASLRTVLIDSLPNDCNTKNQLEDTLAVFPGALQAITINRDYSSLSRRVREQEDLVRRLEAAETQFVRTVLRGRVNKLARQTTAKKALLSRNKSGLHHFMARLTSRKVDKIASYKKQLGKLTEEINKQRASREDFPRLPSVFVTFQDPIAAHMVCQTVIHPRYGYITPRTLPISLDDVVWDNICIGWWQRSVRMVVSNTLAVLLALLCALPAAFAGLLSQIIYLTHAVPWLAWVGRLPHWTLGLIQGVLPPLFLTTLVRIFSWSLEYLVQAQGIPSYSLISLKIQDLYFYFLFVQITLLVSLSAGLTAIVNEIASGGFVAATLAKNLPKASNYFLSYVLLQALSVSANALLRVDRLVDKVILGPLLDKTVTELLERQHGRDIEWGTFVPVYTNLACIGLLYAIISPIILPFQTIAFTLFFVIYSYSGILTTKRDSGGLFYPTALKQLILGVYLMEISLATLFLLVRDSQGRPGCIPQAGLMIVAFALTTVYHHLLCKAFNPLLFYTPTSLQLPAIHPAEATFEHQALTSVPTLRLPEDDSGVSSNETNKLRTDVREIIVSNRQATISTSGHIQLRADSGGFI